MKLEIHQIENFFLSYLMRRLKIKKILDKRIEAIVKKKSFEKMETIIKVILELGSCEIIYFKNLSHKISIAEYNKVSSSFLNKNEVGLINGILHQLANSISND